MSFDIRKYNRKSAKELRTILREVHEEKDALQVANDDLLDAVNALRAQMYDLLPRPQDTVVYWTCGKCGAKNTAHPDDVFVNELICSSCNTINIYESAEDRATQ